MIIVDVETSGINPRRHCLISIGAVDFEHPDVRFSGFCRLPDDAEVLEESLAVNGFTEEQLRDPLRPVLKSLVEDFRSWLEGRDDVVFAGLHPSFDRDFLAAAASRSGVSLPIDYRSVDLHSLVFAHMLSRGLSPVRGGRTVLRSNSISEYVGIPPEPHPHVAINGAVWEVEAFSRVINGVGLLSEFSEFPVPAYLRR